MNNKRGLEVTGVIISLFIALTVLLLMWGLFGGPAKTTIIPFFKNLPNFNFTKQAVEDMGMFRYRISDQSAQYYTGIEWRNFETYEFNKKRAESKLLSQDFIKYYFNLRDYKIINIYVPENGKYINKQVSMEGIFQEPLVKGVITFANYASINGGDYIFNGDGKVYRRNNKIEEQVVGTILKDDFAGVKLNIPRDADSVYAKSDSAVKNPLNDIYNAVFYTSVLEDKTKNFVSEDSWSVKLNDDYEIACNYHNMQNALFSKIDGAVADLNKFGIVKIPCTLNYLDSAVAIPNIKIILTISNPITKTIIDGEIRTSVAVGEEKYELISDATESGNVKEAVVAWLNGVLTNAGKFRYYDIKDKKNPKLKTNSFNVTRIGDDLVVNLNKPVGVEEAGVLFL